MADYKVISIGFRFPGDVVDYYPFNTNQSLLDADIIVFEPDIDCYGPYEIYNGKKLLTIDNSERFQNDLSYLNNELITAFNSKKTIFIFLSYLQELYIKYKLIDPVLYESSVTPILFNNYSVFPFTLEINTFRRGKEMKVISDLRFITEYWKEYKKYSEYQFYFDDVVFKIIDNYSNTKAIDIETIKDIILTTKTGDKAVGAILYKQQKGIIILLPPIKYDYNEFLDANKETREPIWNEKAISFGIKLRNNLIKIHKTITKSREATPQPEWVKKSEYKIEKENDYEKGIHDIKEKIEVLERKKEEIDRKLEKVQEFSMLLYEKGDLLGNAIIEALKLMKFDAKNYKDEESEFDIIFTGEEGRFLGEAEGKDNKAISIEKMDQLERNILEDFAKNGIEEHAKGVLFGNAYRLKPPSERYDFFTEKCFKSAIRSKIALVRTTDLFNVVKYLMDNDDIEYAKRCRKAILDTEGEIVNFPPIPRRSNKESLK